jgi:hypothetical protein
MSNLGKKIDPFESIGFQTRPWHRRSIRFEGDPYLSNEEKECRQFFGVWANPGENFF